MLLSNHFRKLVLNANHNFIIQSTFSSYFNIISLNKLHDNNFPLTGFHFINLLCIWTGFRTKGIFFSIHVKEIMFQKCRTFEFWNWYILLTSIPIISFTTESSLTSPSYSLQDPYRPLLL